MIHLHFFYRIKVAEGTTMHLSFRRFLIGGWLLLPSASPSPATEPCTLTVTSGPVAYQVFQRCERNVADLSFEGTSDFHRPAIVQACVINMLTFLTVQDWQPLGALTDGYWQGALKNVPAGGPYRIEIRLLDAEKNIRATASIEHLLVGDLWILAGQSNMQGAGELVDVELPSLLVHSYGMNERWSIAAEPLHWLMDSIDPVHHPGLDGERLRRDGESQKKSAVAGAGCGLPFAKELVKTTGVPIGLIPCAHGGTSMTQWDPDKKNEAGHSLYGSMLRRFHAVGGKVKGLLWYQGESDANRGDAPQFHDRFSRFIEAVRRDFNAPELPVYFAQISRIVTKDAFPYWDDIREQQRLCAAEIPHCGMVSTLDLPLDDPVHISTPGHKRLGKRFARLVLQHVYGKTEWTHGPTLDYILPLPSRFKRYQVHFKGVNRKLVAVDRPSGFSLRDQNESDLGLLYKTLISSDGKSIDLFLYDQPPPGSCLWYGYGLDPYCNITDAEDMALAAFGPIPL
ncbi:sialate O-acetylesterase, partial [bacterium]|nr:sialate O-acetylesterase [bacterium]